MNIRAVIIQRTNDYPSYSYPGYEWIYKLQLLGLQVNIRATVIWVQVYGDSTVFWKEYSGKPIYYYTSLVLYMYISFYREWNVLSVIQHILFVVGILVNETSKKFVINLIQYTMIKTKEVGIIWPIVARNVHISPLGIPSEHVLINVSDGYTYKILNIVTLMYILDNFYFRFIVMLSIYFT